MGLLSRIETILKQESSIVPILSEEDKNDWGVEGHYSEEEKSQILNEINLVLDQNRMKVDNNTFHIKSSKKGWVFPLVVNLLALLFVLTALFLINFFLSKSSQDSDLNQGPLLLTEARLIEEVRKESETQIREKEEELQVIRQQLQSIEAQKLALEDNFEAELESYKEQVTQEVLLAIEAEIKRLRDAGYAEGEINRRISVFREEKEIEVETLIRQEEQRLAREKAAQEEALQNLRGEYEENLELLDQEKQLLQDSYQDRISTLEEQLKDREEASNDELDQAQLELQSLSDQKDSVDNIRNQVYGFYASIDNSLKRLDYQEAEESLSLFKDFLNSSTYLSLPEISANGAVDFFIVDTMERYVKLLNNDDSITPAIAVDLERVEGFNNAVNLAHGYMVDGNFDKALEEYQQALDQLPEDYQQDNLLERLMLIGWEKEQALIEEQQTLQTGELLAQTDTLLAEGKTNLALDILKDFFQTYPDSRDNKTAVDRIAEIYENTIRQNSEEEERQREDQQNRINDLTQELESLQSTQEELQLSISLLESDLLQKEQSLQLLEADDSTEQLIEITEDFKLLQQETQRLQNMEQVYQRLFSSYQNYTGQEDLLFEDGISEQDLIAGKAELNSFLNDDDMQILFPGFGSRIKIYDQAFEQAGQEGITLELADLLFIFSTLRSDEERIEWISTQREQYDNEEMQEFLDNLELLGF